MAEALVHLARVISVHGLQGVVKAECLSEAPQRLLEAKTVMALFLKGPSKSMSILDMSLGGKYCHIRFESIETPEQARSLVGATLAITRAQLGKSEQGHFVCDMRDLEVRNEAGEVLGQLCGVYETGAQDVYEIKPLQGEAFLIPAIKQVVLRVDPQAGFMVVRLLPGLGPESGI
jgi:16S rRNA processing protein RimM